MEFMGVGKRNCTYFGPLVYQLQQSKSVMPKPIVGNGTYSSKIKRNHEILNSTEVI
jgi:hypothetical protein